MGTERVALSFFGRCAATAPLSLRRGGNSAYWLVFEESRTLSPGGFKKNNHAGQPAHSTARWDIDGIEWGWTKSKSDGGQCAADNLRRELYVPVFRPPVRASSSVMAVAVELVASGVPCSPLHSHCHARPVVRRPKERIKQMKYDQQQTLLV